MSKMVWSRVRKTRSHPETVRAKAAVHDAQLKAHDLGHVKGGRLPPKAELEMAHLTMRSAKLPVAFASGFTGGILDRAPNCQCTWTVPFPAASPGMFALKYVNRNCPVLAHSSFRT